MGLLSSWCQAEAKQPQGCSCTHTPLLLPVAPEHRGMWYPRQSVCEGVRHFFFKHTIETSAGLGLFVK